MAPLPTPTPGGVILRTPVFEGHAGNAPIHMADILHAAVGDPRHVPTVDRPGPANGQLGEPPSGGSLAGAFGKPRPPKA